jgi:hypothetical protein
MRSSACDTLIRLCVRHVLCWSAFPLVSALGSAGSAATGSAADCSAADMALAAGHPTVDQRKLEAKGIIQRKPVKIGLREELASQAGDPEVVDRSCKVDCHCKDQAGNRMTIEVG